MQVNREELLKQLESVLPGLSTRELIEQSSCFVFQKKQIKTFNEEVACTQDSCLDITGAVVAMPLINTLRKLSEDTLDIAVEKDILCIRGKRKQASLRIESEILLPVGEVEIPSKWKKLPDDFSDAVSIVQYCAGKDENLFVLSCIHLHPNWVETFDRYQIARYKMDLDIKKSILVKKDSLIHIISLDMIEFSITENWIHFKSSSGLILSCRRWTEDFPETTKHLQVEGTPISFPKGLIDAKESDSIFSSENIENESVLIKLQPGKLKIIGRGISGSYHEVKKVKYNGKPLCFRIPPKLLINIVDQYNTCQITAGQLIIKTGKYTYTTVLENEKTHDRHTT